MSLHLVLWQIDETKFSPRPLEKEPGWCLQSLENALSRDLGFDRHGRGQNGSGRALVDGQIDDTVTRLAKYAPYVKYRLFPMGNINNTETWMEILNTRTAN